MFKNKFKTRLRIIFIIVGFTILFALFNWNSFNMPYERDEGEYAYSAWLLDQGIMPYKNSFLIKPPMIVYTYWLAYKINPDAYWPPRLIGAIFTLLTIVLIGLIAKKEFGKQTGLIAIFLAVPMLTSKLLSSFAANTEKFMLLPLVGLLALYVFNRKNNSLWPWFLGGFLSLVAISYKQIALLVILFIFVIWLVETWKNNYDDKIKLLIKKILVALDGVLLAFFIIFGFFIYQGVLNYLWENLFLFNKYYVALRGLYLGNFFENLKMFFLNWSILFALLFWFIYKQPMRWQFYIGLIIISLLTIFQFPFGHFYLLLMPYWVIICSFSIKSLIFETAFISHLSKVPDTSQKSAAFVISERIIKYFLALAIVLSIFLFPLQSHLLKSPAELNLWIYGKSPPFIESKKIAEKIKALSSPDDYVYIAGSEPQILYYAKRLSSNRFIVSNPLIYPTPLLSEYQQEVVDSLSANPPKFVIFIQSMWNKCDKGQELILEYLSELINNQYTLVDEYSKIGQVKGCEEFFTYKNQIFESDILLFQRNT